MIAEEMSGMSGGAVAGYAGNAFDSKPKKKKKIKKLFTLHGKTETWNFNHGKLLTSDC